MSASLLTLTETSRRWKLTSSSCWRAESCVDCVSAQTCSTFCFSFFSNFKWITTASCTTLIFILFTSASPWDHMMSVSPASGCRAMKIEHWSPVLQCVNIEHVTCPNCTNFDSASTTASCTTLIFILFTSASPWDHMMSVSPASGCRAMKIEHWSPVLQCVNIEHVTCPNCTNFDSALPLLLSNTPA